METPDSVALAAITVALLVTAGCEQSTPLYPPACTAVLGPPGEFPEYWLDSSGDMWRLTTMERAGQRVTSTFHPDTPLDCDHQDGTGTITYTEQDFSAEIGVEVGTCVLSGEIMVCRWGVAQTELNGLVPVPFRAEVVEGPRIVGVGGPDEITGRSVNVEYTARDCEPKPPEAYLRPPEPGAVEYRTDYFPDTQQISHTVVDDFRTAQTVEVLPSVTGVVSSVGVTVWHPDDRRPRTTITLDVPGTDHQLHVGMIGDLTSDTAALVQTGDEVVPDQAIGLLGPHPDNAEEFTIRLSATGDQGEPINPDCLPTAESGEIMRRP